MSLLLFGGSTHKLKFVQGEDRPVPYRALVLRCFKSCAGLAANFERGPLPVDAELSSATHPEFHNRSGVRFNERVRLMAITDDQRHLSDTAVLLPFGIPEPWPTCGPRVGGKD